jgi:hypothetical protein
MRSADDFRAGAANPDCLKLASNSASPGSAAVRGEPVVVAPEFGRSFIDNGKEA